MVRLTDLSDSARENVEALDCPSFDVTPWVSGKALSQQCIALISTAGLIRPGEQPFRGEDASWREISDDVPDSQLTCSHISVNFDRTGLQRDMNVALPRARLKELADSGVIGGVADAHYTFMGATDPIKMEANARELAKKLLANGVDAAVLAPV